MKRAARKQVQKFGTGGLNRYSSTMSDRLKAPKLSSKEQARIQQAIDQGFTNIAYHSTNTPWDEIDLNYTDVGFHAGTPTQATNRALDKAIQAGLQKTREEGKYIDTTNILPIAYRPGKTLVTPDVGEWKDAYETLLSLRNVPALRGQSWMDETLDYLESQRAPYERMKKLDEYQQSPENLRALSEIRDELLNQGYRQIRYENRVENALGSSTDLLPDYAEQVKRMTDEARALYKKGLSLRPESPPPDLGATQEAVEAWLAQTPRDPLSYLDPEEAALYAKYRDDVRRIENTPAFYDSPHSIIFLDPARDVRSANAPFAPEAAQEPGFWKKEGGLAKFGTGGLGRAATQVIDEADKVNVSEAGVIKGKADQILSQLPGRNQLNLWIEEGDEAIESGWNSTGDPIVILDRILIDPDLRRQGYGRRVLEQAIRDAAEALPGGELKLLADPIGNDGINLSDLVQFYESLGFSIDNYQQGMSGVPMSLMLPSSRTPVTKKDGGLAKFGTGGLGRAATDLADKPRVTDTPEFKNWFGDSAVRDAEGVPRVVYHGTMTPGIEVFDRKASLSKGDGRRPSIDQIGLWTSSIEGDVQTGGAARYGKTVMPLYAKMEHPLELASHTELEKMWRDFHNSDKEMRLAGMSPERIEKARKLSKTGPLFGDPDGFRQSLINVGYDGIVIPEWRGDFLEGDAPQDLYIALDPTKQIKSAIGNKGTFDPANPMITKKDGGPVYDPSRINQMVDDLLDPMYEFEPYDDAAYEIKRFGTGGLNKVPSRQWLKDVVEQDVEPYLNYFGNPAQMAFDNWLKGTATKYLKRDFGTEFDPMRDLSIRHVQSDVWPPREIGPYSQPAKAVNPMWQKLNPWLKDLDPETPVYTSLRPGTLEEPGLNMRHLRDELMNAMSAEAGLPRNLQIRPESLQRMSFPQASELVGKINQYRAEQAARRAAELDEKLKPDVFKQYPEGYRWVRLNKPGQFEAESELMGHSVRGYEPDAGPWYGLGGWPAIERGEAQVYSLRDPQGLPHVTVETGAYPKHDGDFVFYELQDKLGRNPTQEEWDAAMAGKAPIINQIKGKQNKAPVSAYLPFVQDFVRSGNWSYVGDLENAGLRDAAREFSGRPQPQQRYMTDAEYDDYLLQLLRDEQAPNMKEGGIVEDDFLNANPKGREPLTWTDLLARYAPDPMNALIAAFEMQTTPNERGLTGLALNTLAVPNVLKDLGSIGSSVIEGGVESLAPEAAERMRTASERGAASREMLVPGAIQDLASLAMEGSKRATNEYDALLDQMLASRGLGPADTLTWPNQFALALGEMLGQGPLPSAKKAEVAKAAATKLRDMIALPFEYILPTVDAKPSSYALGTALGGALRTAFSNPEEPPTTRELVENVPARPTRERMSYTPPAFPGMAEGGPVYDPARIESMVNELMEPKKFGTGGLNQVTGKAAGKAGVPGNLPEAERTIITDAVERELALPNSTVELLAPQRRANYGRSTIRGAGRKTYPRIFENPRIIVSSAAEQVAPESEALRRLFNVTREDLYDMSMAREPTVWLPPGAPKKPKGTAHASPIMLPANTQRLQDTLAEALNSPLRPGMIGWYMMDPAYQRLLQLADPEDAAQMFRDFNTLTGIHSAQSDVATELTRGSAMNWLNREGRLEDYIRFARKMGLPGAPLDMRNVPGHMGHKTSHLKPALRYLDTAQLSQQAKTPAYITASMPPELGTQSNFAVGDAHFSRAIGLPDVRNLVRNKKTGLYEPDVASWSMPEAMQLQDWWANKVAGPVGLQGVPGQALLWGAEAPITGVESLIGAPKLEILADLIMKTAARLNVSPEKARDLVLTGKTYAGYADGGLVSYLQHMARNER